MQQLKLFLLNVCLILLVKKFKDMFIPDGINKLLALHPELILYLQSIRF